jgi:uncharacterized cupin superfamily protein
MTTDESGRVKAVIAAEVAPPAQRTIYPAPFAARVSGRVKRRLGDAVGLKNFGVNLTRLAPGSMSALLHRHSHQDEFVYVLEGTPTLVTESGEVTLGPGSCAGFPAGGEAHQLVNRSSSDVLYLEVGDRTAGDQASYPADDLKATLGADGKWLVTHKDGTPY